VVSLATVKTHVNHIFGKLGAESRVQVVARARTVGLV
jgi:ATP/maltotriose-dependent transcriptional regulator MalT